MLTVQIYMGTDPGKSQLPARDSGLGEQKRWAQDKDKVTYSGGRLALCLSCDLTFDRLGDLARGLSVVGPSVLLGTEYT